MSAPGSPGHAARKALRAAKKRMAEIDAKRALAKSSNRDRNPLAMFTEAELMAELASRRQRRDSRRHDRFCSECVHFQQWADRTQAPPPGFTTCAKGQRVSFKVQSQPGAQWGFYKRGCEPYKPVDGATE